ncbi:MAG: transcription antitermination factor NusB [Chloroflexi bacterium]|nr:MAG: transcription antitermination factor NusB [Anaerolineaceae bacterium 4572_32.1]RLC90041.1 MAG: transcription antitermination factor NusB [Chloroflexota bacterium]
MKVRHQSRVLALQALYEIDCAHHAPGIVLERRLSESRLPESGTRFVRHLVNGVLKYQSVLDTFIHSHAPEWPLEQMAYIDRNVLRMALFEFAVDGSTPVKVVINEAVELAKTFGSDSAPRFVNGVLGTLVEHKKAIAQAVRGLAEKKQ